VPRSVVRVALTRFLLLSFGTLVVVGAGTLVLSRNIAENEAIRDNQMRAERLGPEIDELIDRAARQQGPGTTEALYRSLDELAEESMKPVAESTS